MSDSVKLSRAYLKDVSLQAMEHARSLTREYKSGNKFNPLDPAKVARSDEADRRITRYRKELKVLKVSQPRCVKDLVIGAELIASQQAGNCTELCKLALAYMYETFELNHVEMISFEDLDHCFLAVGVDSNSPNTAGSRFRTFKVWGSNTIICDPWANIVCGVRDYPSELINKLKKWRTQGKIVTNSNGNAFYSDKLTKKRISRSFLEMEVPSHLEFEKPRGA